MQIVASFIKQKFPFPAAVHFHKALRLIVVCRDSDTYERNGAITSNFSCCTRYVMLASR